MATDNTDTVPPHEMDTGDKTVVMRTDSDHTVDISPTSMKPQEPVSTPETAKLNTFQKFLSVWVLVAMCVGLLIGTTIPTLSQVLETASIAGVSIPISVLLWGMILPMMMQVDFACVVNVVRNPVPVVMTSVINYGVQPFTMYGFAVLWFKVCFGNVLTQGVSDGYVIGSVLLGGAPCTAMVFVWSMLMGGDGAYTVTQVAVNDILLIAVYGPTVKLLAGTSNIQMPWDTLLYSILLFVVVPLVTGVSVRMVMSRNDRWFMWLEKKLIPVMDSCAMVFLVLMVALLFISQASTVTHNLVDIVIIAVPLTLQTVFIWAIAFGTAVWIRLPYEIAGPATLIACSNFFEMAAAIAVSVYGSGSSAALATVVGVLIEVPVMLALVWVNNKNKHLFKSS